jgi:hypothetical protein
MSDHGTQDKLKVTQVHGAALQTHPHNEWVTECNEWVCISLLLINLTEVLADES